MKETDMIIGQRFAIDGYDLVAKAQVMMGGGPVAEVIVLNNNSSH
jgi:hypothetical protein